MYDEIIKCLHEKIDDLQKENKRMQKVFDIKDAERAKLVNENKELQNDYSKVVNANKGLIKHIKQLTRSNYQLSTQFENLNTGFNNLTDLLAKRTAENAELDDENKMLKLKIKMMTKNHFNRIYGTTVYTDTDSIKETTENDSNN